MFFGIGFGIFWNWWGMNSGPPPVATAMTWGDGTAVTSGDGTAITWSA